MAEDNEEQSPFTRRGFVAATVVVALIVVLGLVIVIVNMNRDDPDPAPTTSTSVEPTSAAPTSEPPEVAGGPSVCGLDGEELDTARLTTAPAVEQVVERPAAAPIARAEAPRRVPTLAETIENNAWDGLVGKMNFQFASGRIYLTLGLFILGFIVGRIRLFQRMDEFRSRLNYGALVALVLIGLLYLLKPYIPAASWREVSINAWMGATTTNLINLMTAYLWVVLVLEAYRSVKVQNAMKPLVSYGRMGLTNYIVQSVTGVFIFSGFGLDWSHLGVFLSVLVCLGFTAIQIAFSQYWLSGLRYGPMEWLWRTGTYMKWQPIRLG